MIPIKKFFASLLVSILCVSNNTILTMEKDDDNNSSDSFIIDIPLDAYKDDSVRQPSKFCSILRNIRNIPCGRRSNNYRLIPQENINGSQNIQELSNNNYQLISQENIQELSVEEELQQQLDELRNIENSLQELNDNDTVIEIPFDSHEQQTKKCLCRISKAQLVRGLKISAELLAKGTLAVFTYHFYEDWFPELAFFAQHNFANSIGRQFKDVKFAKKALLTAVTYGVFYGLTFFEAYEAEKLLGFRTGLNVVAFLALYKYLNDYFKMINEPREHLD